METNEPKLTYAAWMAQLQFRAVNTNGVQGRCLQAVRLMVETFPELKPVSGRVLLTNGERICHVWAVTPTGALLDPTAAQFDAPVLEYKPLADEDPKPTGQCLECWDYRYGKGGFCSDRCRRRQAKRNKQDPEAMSHLMLRLLGDMNGARDEQFRQDVQMDEPAVGGQR